jgi:RND family efflux transporter MFP subunit
MDAAEKSRTPVTIATTGWMTLGLVALAATVPACAAGDREPAPASRDPLAVAVSPVAAVDTPGYVDAGGVVSARDTALVASRLVATIAAVRVRAGDRVAAGDVLVTLDARDVDAQGRQAAASALAAERALAQARTAQTAAEADHTLAQAWHRRISGLHARRAATDQERDEAEARLAAAAARVAGATAGREAADAQLEAARAGAAAGLATSSFTTVRAPFAGVVTERLADPGSLAAPGAPLLRLEAAGPRQVVARIDATRAAAIRAGDRVPVLVDAGDAAQPPERVEGVVSEVARDVAADARAFSITVTLPPAVTARTGTFARVRIPTPARRALLVPATAIRRHGQVTSVFVVQDRVARLRLVHLGEPLDGGVDVLAGLEAGEAVVTSPPPALVDGTPVASGATARKTGGVS